jgi:hypothetical protein
VSCANAGSITITQNQSIEPEANQGAMAKELGPLSAVKVAGTGDRLSLAFDLARAGKARIAVCDGTGRIVATSTLAGNVGRNETSVSLTTLSSGIYFYRLEANNATSAGKFTVIR